MAVHRDLEVYSVSNFGGGLDVQTSPFTLADRRAQDRLVKAQNMVYTSSGAVTKRYDQDKYNATTLGAAVAITGGVQFRRSNGTDYIVCGTDDGRLVKLLTDGTTANITTGLTTGTRWYFATYNDKLICANRADTPKKWDGTTLAVLGGTPPPTGGPVVVHSNRVFFLDGTNFSTLTWSALNNEEDYTAAGNAGSVQINPNDGQNLIAMISASKSELVLTKPNSVYRLQGTAPATYAITSVIPAMTGAGCISPQGMLYALNDIWMAAVDGIHDIATVQQFGDLKTAYASQRIAPYFRANTSYSLTLTNLNKACSAFDRQNARLYFAFDSDSDGKNDTLLVYDLALKPTPSSLIETTGPGPWSVWTGQSIASMWPVYNASTGKEEIFAGGYDGFVRVLNRHSAPNAITGSARHVSNLRAPGIQKSPRHLFLYLAEQGNYTVTVDTKFDFGATGGQVAAVSLLGNSHTLGVNWVLGTDPLGKAAQLAKRVDLSGIGEYLEIGVTNSNAGEPFTWAGYQVMWRPRRLVRRAA